MGPPVWLCWVLVLGGVALFCGLCFYWLHEPYEDDDGTHGMMGVH